MSNTVIKEMQVLDPNSKINIDIDIGSNAKNVDIPKAEGEILIDLVEGYYYNNAFYEDAAHTIAIAPNINKGYKDLGTTPSNTYIYKNNQYVLTSVIESNVASELRNLQQSSADGVLWSEENVLGAKNFIPIGSSSTQGTFLFTVDQDTGYIQLSGNTQGASDAPSYEVIFPEAINESCIFTILQGDEVSPGVNLAMLNCLLRDSEGVAIGGFQETVTSDTYSDQPSGQIIIPANRDIKSFKITVYTNKTFSSTATIKPMLRLATISNRTYVPYTKTNRELTKISNQIDNKMNIDGSNSSNVVISEGLTLGARREFSTSFTGSITKPEGYINVITTMTSSSSFSDRIMFFLEALEGKANQNKTCYIIYNGERHYLSIQEIVSNTTINVTIPGFNDPISESSITVPLVFESTPYPGGLLMGDRSLAINSSIAQGTYAVATASGAFARGISASASGAFSLANGNHVNAKYPNQIVTGNYNDNKSTSLFEVGNGTAENDRSNAFEVYNDGKISQNNGTLKYQITTADSNKRIGISDNIHGSFHPFAFELTILNTSSQTYSFDNSNITTNSTIDVYSSIYGENPSSVVATAGNCTVTFDEAKTRDVKIKVS